MPPLLTKSMWLCKRNYLIDRFMYLLCELYYHKWLKWCVCLFKKAIGITEYAMFSFVVVKENKNETSLKKSIRTLHIVYLSWIIHFLLGLQKNFHYKMYYRKAFDQIGENLLKIYTLQNLNAQNICLWFIYPIYTTLPSFSTKLWST